MTISATDDLLLAPLSGVPAIPALPPVEIEDTGRIRIGAGYRLLPVTNA